MNPKQTPPEFIESLLNAIGNPDPAELEAWLASQGYPSDDEPVCLAAIPPDQWVDNCKVLPTPAIQRYLASGDTLTNHTIDMMECALETAYQVTAPWCITSMRTGSEDEGNLNVDYFYLLAEA